MDFDIFKRFTKYDRLVELKKGFERKLSTEETDTLCNRLSINKNEKMKRVKKQRTESTKDNKGRRLNEEESEKLYERLIGWGKNVELKIEAQRAIKKKELEKKELEKQECVVIKKVEPRVVVERLYADPRNKKSEYARKRQLLLESEQVTFISL